MNKLSAFLSLCLLGGSGLFAQDFLVNHQATVSFGSGAGYQNPRIAPVGNRVYMADSQMGVLVWDISESSRPVPIGEYRMTETSYLAGIAAEGSTVYVIDNSDYSHSRLRILDLSDPTAGIELGVLGGPDADPQMTTMPDSIHVEGGLCYLWQTWGELYVADVSGDWREKSNRSCRGSLISIGCPAVTTGISIPMTKQT